MELNLENPIFVVYLNIDGMSPQKAEEQIAVLSKYMSYENATNWIIPIKNGDSRVELIWQGSKYSTNPGIVNFNNFENTTCTVLTVYNLVYIYMFMYLL